MRKIGKKYSYFLIIILFSTLHVYTQDLQFISKASKYKVSRFDEFELTYSINGQGTNFKEPKNLRDNFIIISGPNNKTFTRFDGNTLYIENSITYIVMPKKAGKFIIGEATISVNGKSYASKPIQIEVTNAPVEENNNPNDPKNIAKKLAFVRVKLSKNTFFIGEGFTVDYLLYYKTNVMNIEILNEPSFRGFYAELLKDEIKPFQETVNGEMYNVVTLKRYLVIGQKAGKFDLGPLEVRIPTEVSTGQRDFFNPFFRSSSVVNQVSVFTTPPITIKALPEYKGAYTYTGAVGSYSFDAKLSRNNVQVGESTSLHLTAEGTGNVKMITFPELSFPKQLDVFEPKYSEKYSITSKGMSGKKSLEYVILPKFNGTYKIPKIVFVHFDPSVSKYVEKIIDNLEITATGGQDYMVSNNKEITNDKARMNVSYLNRDILFIKTTADWINTSRFYDNSSLLFWWILIFISIFILVIVFNRIFVRYLMVFKKNIAYKTAIAQILKTAESEFSDTREKLHYINKKFHTIIKEYFNSEHTGNFAGNVLQMDSTPLKEYSDELQDVIKQTETALYGQIPEVEIQKIYVKYKDVLSRIAK